MIAMMNKCFLSTLFVLIALSASAQIEFQMGYAYSRANGAMLRNLKNVHGAVFSLGYRAKKLPISYGVEIGIQGYGYQTERQFYTFDDGSVTETNVNVSNNIFSAVGYARLYYPNKSFLQPYLQVRGGLSNFYTSLVIEDPQDVDGCTPLESDILKSSSTLAGSVGIGTRIKLSERYGIDVGTSYTSGGKVDYMSLKASTQNAKPANHVVADFINHKTQVIHQHHVGYVYRSPVRLLDWRLTFFAQF
jgi:hypothetical protein